MSRKQFNKPIILDFYNFNEEHKNYLVKIKDRFVLSCRSCDQKIRASIRVTSNWISHLRTQHPIEYDRFEKLREARVSHQVSTLTNIRNYVKVNKKFSYIHPFQKK